MIEPAKFSITISLLSLSLSACSTVIRPPAPVVSDNSPYLDYAQDGRSPNLHGTRGIQYDQGSQQGSGLADSAPAYRVIAIQDNSHSQADPLRDLALSSLTNSGNAAFTVAQAGSNQLAGVGASTKPQLNQIPEFYTVQPGENLFRIASRFGLNYQDIARLNNIDPDSLSIGQVIRLRSSDSALTIDAPSAVKTPIQQQAQSKSSSRSAQLNPDGRPLWRPPTDGQIIERFNPSNNTGIRFAGIEGQPIRAVNDGKVVYVGVGNAIRGYQNLILIQDVQGIITAYANNKNVLVKLNDSVKANQQIAQMGIDPATNKATLKFEIRKAGSPVDPTPYLVQ